MPTFSHLTHFLSFQSPVHETSHWILTKIQGFRTDALRKDEANKASVTGKIGPSNISVSQAGQTKPDYLIAIGQRPDDAGARSTDMLIGATAKVISFADGKSRILTSCLVIFTIRICYVLILIIHYCVTPSAQHRRHRRR